MNLTNIDIEIPTGYRLTNCSALEKQILIPDGYMLVKRSTYYDTQERKDSVNKAVSKYYYKNKDAIISKHLDNFKTKYDNDPEFNKAQRKSSRIRSATTRLYNSTIKKLQENKEEYKEEEVLEQVRAIVLEKEKLKDDDAPIIKRKRTSKKNNMLIEKVDKKVLVSFD